MPSKTTFSDQGYINYQYSASGMKQMVWGSAPGQGSKSQFYLGNYVYSNGVKQLLVDGGYVTFSGTTPQYHFYVKDHLGNNRMVVNASGTVEQVSHYYAFGGLMGENTGSDLQDFKYNGKELDRLHGLDWYDYNARHMDAVRGVFTTMDPLAEKYYDISPYAYCANNPINYIDKRGEFPLLANCVGAAAGALAEYGSQVITNVAEKGPSVEVFTNINYKSIAIAGAEGFITSGSSVIKRTGQKVAAHITATIAKNVSDVLEGEATIGDAVVNSSIDMMGVRVKIKTRHFQVMKTTTANQAIKAAKSKGRKVTTAEAKKIASDTRRNNIVKKETNAVINDYADSSVSLAATSVIKGIRKRLKNEEEENRNKK